MEKFLKLSIQTADVKTQMFDNEEHLIVPLIGLVEQVILSSNATQPNLVLAEEFKKAPAGWNGRPVVIDHPQVNGEHVSANSPEILDSEEIGQLFNSRVEDNKLKFEAWINMAKVERRDETVQEIVNKIKEGKEIVEVSTGLFADIEEKTGEFNGEHFDGVWRNIVPDHLAILSESKGACSVEDGCGIPRLNAKGECTCGGSCDICTAQERTDTLINRFENSIKDQRKKLSDVDKRTLLNRELRQKVDDFWMIEAIYNKSVVYFAGDKFYEQSYKVESNGSVTFEGDRIEVLPETRFVQVTSNRSDKMDKEKFVNTLIENKATKFSEEDKSWLMSQEEETLEKLEPAHVEPPADVEPPVVVKEPDPEEKVEANKADPTVEEYLKNAPASVRETLTDSMNMLNARRERLITKVFTNDRNKFTKKQLEVKPIDELESIVNLIMDNDEPDDYSGRGGERDVVYGTNEAPNPMPTVFDFKKSA